MNPEVYQKYGFKQWPGYIAMLGASWRAERAEHGRQFTGLTDEELVLYGCLNQGQLESVDRDLYGQGFIEVRPGPNGYIISGKGISVVRRRNQIAGEMLKRYILR